MGSDKLVISRYDGFPEPGIVELAREPGVEAHVAHTAVSKSKHVRCDFWFTFALTASGKNTEAAEQIPRLLCKRAIFKLWHSVSSREVLRNLRVHLHDAFESKRIPSRFQHCLFVRDTAGRGDGGDDHGNHSRTTGTMKEQAPRDESNDGFVKYLMFGVEADTWCVNERSTRPRQRKGMGNGQVATQDSLLRNRCQERMGSHANGRLRCVGDGCLKLPRHCCPTSFNLALFQTKKAKRRRQNEKRKTKKLVDLAIGAANATPATPATPATTSDTNARTYHRRPVRTMRQ